MTNSKKTKNNGKTKKEGLKGPSKQANWPSKTKEISGKMRDNALPRKR